MSISPNALDHVALWVEDPDPLAAFACDHLGMHVIERTDAFTLVGADARRGKLTLFVAEGPRERGALERVVLRVFDLDAALDALPGALHVRREDGEATFEAPQGLGVGLVQRDADGPEYDLDHVVLRVPDPPGAAEELQRLGFSREDEGRLAVADKHLALRPGGAPEPERPLLNHLALLVDSAEQVRDEAERDGFEIVDFKDAPNTLAVFLWGPERLKLEYVEHKPGFALE